MLWGGSKLTQPGINVTEHSGWLHPDGVDVCHGLHLNPILHQQLLDLLRLGQNGD